METGETAVELAVSAIESAIEYWRKAYITSFELAETLMVNSILVSDLFDEEDGILNNIEAD